MDIELTDETLQEIYMWVDSIELSRPKRQINRDFADALCMAEVIHSEFPRLVDLHNYPPANSFAQKLYNWQTLQQKVLSRLHVRVPPELLKQAANSTPGAIEQILCMTKKSISEIKRRNAARAAGEVPSTPTAESQSAHARPYSAMSFSVTSDAPCSCGCQEVIMRLRAENESLRLEVARLQQALQMNS